MKINKYFILVTVILLVIVGIQTGHAQPPPPPPPTDNPPCWPPPCIPVDNGILFAMMAAVLFGAVAIFKSFRKRIAQ